MKEPTLFDKQEAVAARDAAITRVEANADRDWKAAAIDVVQILACEMDEFTTDAVWDYLTRYRVDVDTHEPRALGPVMRAAGRNGWVIATHRYEPSARPQSHCRPVRVWRSLLR